MPEPLRIAMLGIRGIPANYGGFETCAQEVATRLAERGHQVTVYGRSHHQPSSPATYRGVRLVTLPTIRQKFLDTPIHTLLATAHAIRKPYDVIIIFGVGNSPQSWLLKRLGRNIILNVDGLDWQRDKWPPIARWLLKRAEQLAGQSAQAVITDSHHVQRHFQRSYNRSLTHIPYGASPPPTPDHRLPTPDSPVPSPNPGSRAPVPDPPNILTRLNLESNQYILYVGRLEPENRIHDLIQAAHLADLPVPTIIVGDAPYATPYKAHLQHICQHPDADALSSSHHHMDTPVPHLNAPASNTAPHPDAPRNYSLETGDTPEHSTRNTPDTRSHPTTDSRLPIPDPPNIHLVGAHYGPDYWTLLRNAGIYVFPVASAGTHPALIEAMAAGNLVLVRDTPDNRSVGGDTVLYFESPNQLAGLLRRTIDQPQIKEEYGPRAAQRANDLFNWDRVTDQYEHLAQTLVHPPTTPSRRPTQPTDPQLTNLLTTLTFTEPRGSVSGSRVQVLDNQLSTPDSRPHPTPDHRLSTSEFQRLAAMHGVGPLLGQRVEQGQLTISPEIDAWLIEQYHHNITRQQRITTKLQTILQSCASSHLSAIPLKGAALLLHATNRDLALPRLNAQHSQLPIQTPSLDCRPERSSGISPENRQTAPITTSKEPHNPEPTTQNPPHPTPDLSYRPMADIDLLITSPNHQATDLALAGAGYARPQSTGTGLSGLNWKHHTYHPITPQTTQSGDMSPGARRSTPPPLGEHPDHPCTVESHQHVVEAHRRISWDMSPEILADLDLTDHQPLPSLPAIVLHLTVHASVAALDSRLRIIHIYDLQQLIRQAGLSSIHRALQRNNPSHIARFLYPALRLCQRHGLHLAELDDLITQLQPHLPPNMASWIDSATFEQLAWTHRHQPPTSADPDIWAISTRDRLQLARTSLLPAPRDLDTLGHQGSGPRAILSWYPRHFATLLRRALSH